MNKLAIVFFTIVFAWSCTSVNIQKRKYRNGFHVSIGNKADTGKETLSSLKTEECQPKSKTEKEEINVSSLPLTFLYQNKEIGIKENVFVEDGRQEHNYITSENRKAKKENNIKELFVGDKSIGGNVGFLSLLLSIGILPILFHKSNFRKKGTVWASRNVGKSRILIVSASVFSFIGGSILGSIHGVEINLMNFAGVVSSLLLGANFYENASSSDRKKLGLAVFTIGTVAAPILIGNDLIELLIEDGNPFVIEELWLRILLTVLIVVALAAASFGILMLACHLSCSGYVALSIIIPFILSVVALMLSAVGITHVYKKKEDTKETIKAKLSRNALILILSVLAVLLGIAGLNEL